jgi:hypothetical protein
MGMLSASTDAGRADQSSEQVAAALLSGEQLPAWPGNWKAVTAGTSAKGCGMEVSTALSSSSWLGNGFPW